MTHKSPKATWTCSVYNWIVYVLLTSETKPRGFINYELDVANKNMMPMPSTGHCTNTLHNALWAFLTTDSFEDAVVAVVNLGGDADTVGAVCGGLAGTFYGFDAIPKRWLDVLEKKDELDEVALGLLATRKAVEQMGGIGK